MKINDELFEIGKNSVGICRIINEDYVLVSKKMPVKDEELDKYIKSIKEAKKNGINISEITDYKFIDGTTSSFGYTKGVFIENRAKGNTLSFKQFYLNDNDKKEIIDNYMSDMVYYIDEIERRSEADISVYDKLIEDLLNLSKYNLEVDPKPTNFFFDENVGYTIIDVIPNAAINNNEFISKYIKAIVFGYGIPHLYLDNGDISMMSIDLYNRYNKAKRFLVDKIEISLVNHGIELDNTFDFIRNEKDPNIVDYVDIYDYVDNRIDEHNKYKR